jgi:hypothetical protein
MPIVGGAEIACTVRSSLTSRLSMFHFYMHAKRGAGKAGQSSLSD